MVGDPDRGRRLRRFAIALLIAVPVAYLLSFGFPQRTSDATQAGVSFVLAMLLFGLAWFVAGWIEQRWMR